MIEYLHKIIKRYVTYHPLNKHRDEHHRQVAEIALKMAEINNESEELKTAVVVAALTHDTGRQSNLTSEDPEHGKKSVILLKEYISELPVSPAFYEEIYFAVENHTTGIKTDRAIAKYLWNADRIALCSKDIYSINPSLMSGTVWRKVTGEYSS
jgi:HD superfamily phosphohydrolase YqeK